MGNQRPPAVDGIKIFDNDDQVAKHYCCLPTMTLQWKATVMFWARSSLSKNLIPSAAKGLDRPLYFTSFSACPFQILDRNFFTPGVFCLRYTLLHISKLKEIASEFPKIFVPPTFSFFFDLSYIKITFSSFNFF